MRRMPDFIDIDNENGWSAIDRHPALMTHQAVSAVPSLK
jgi:hypothetical protein